MKYELPQALVGRCEEETYRRWLDRKAAAHKRRDRGRGNSSASKEAYKIAIHTAVQRDGLLDAYTGRPLRWDLIGKYDNETSKLRGRHYKHELGDLPTVDHVGNGLGPPDFRICAWRTNDAKNDLSYAEFVELCKAVVAHAG
ncbi:MAG: hypothetical protein KF901_19790 [Myxococcales bacterium]|nr:hypothetical protein [Myxococcales bacterium]